MIEIAESAVRVLEETPQYAIVELMGHVKIAGRLSEEEKFGSKLGRLDVPDGDGFRTVYFGGSSVYRIQLVTEAVARHVARTNAPPPVSPWDFPKALPAAPDPLADATDRFDEDDFNDDGDPNF